MNLLDKIDLLRGSMPMSKLERECGLSQNSIKKWAISVPRSDQLAKVANYFNVSVDWLLGLTDSPDEKKPTPKEVDLETFAAALKEKGLNASDFSKLSKEQWAVIADIIKNFKQ